MKITLKKFGRDGKSAQLRKLIKSVAESSDIDRPIRGITIQLQSLQVLVPKGKLAEHLFIESIQNNEHYMKWRNLKKEK